MNIADQLERLEHAVRALEWSGARIIQASASSYVKPYVLVDDTPQAEFIVGEVSRVRSIVTGGDWWVCDSESTLGVTLSWNEKP